MRETKETEVGWSGWVVRTGVSRVEGLNKQDWSGLKTMVDGCCGGRQGEARDKVGQTKDQGGYGVKQTRNLDG